MVTARTTFNLAAIGLALLAGCRAASPSAAPPASATKPLSNAAPDARPCGASDPRIEARIGEVAQGEPPDRDVALDLRVKNPLDRPVWLILPDTEPAGATRKLSLIRVGSATAPLLVWEWDTGRALRLPAKAEITFRRFSVSVSDRVESASLWLANEIRVEGVAASQWLGQPGLTPESGEYVLSDDSSTPTPVALRQVANQQAAEVEVELLCRADARVTSGSP